ncbi:hypothetical protein SAMN06265348_113226 [Pedobacter westerhofensis]|uniref:DUF4306 domain-containing protein n=1 Tax=Pedobacter westerhofensis TaxID=425512 RepID=A0A521FLR0_9SPHI|nr:hypothetical protein [Pedobacter westerhofensis]SMO97056.1 hypothetical protein SAMN06265348_113226 [Pedobacter westerhofensis]
MKRIFLCLDVTLIFIALTIWLSENNVLADGYLKYGIPFNFYAYSEAKSDDPNFYTSQGFYPKYLFLDLLVLLILIVMVNYLAVKLKFIRKV